MTFEVTLYFMKILFLKNVGIHRILFYQNRFLNDCARKKKTIIPQLHIFFVEVEELKFIIKIK